MVVSEKENKSVGFLSPTIKLTNYEYDWLKN